MMQATMNIVVGALGLFLAAPLAHAASAMTNHTIRSAAAWERCTGRTVTAEQAAQLADLLSRHPLETAPLTKDEVLGEIQNARAGVGACTVPLTMVEQDYFEKYLLPRIAKPPGASQSAATSADGIAR
jgi:hypothetical protein